MTDTPTLTLWELCKHEMCEEHVMYRNDEIIEPCPGGRERTFREELAVIEAGANVVHVLVEVTNE